AGAVVARQRQYFAREQRHRHRLERVHTAEMLGDRFDLEQRGGRVAHARPPPMRRWLWSTSTEMMITMPTATNCQNASTSTNTSRNWITAMTKAPISVPPPVPEPPNRLAPPITTAAMLSSSRGSPAIGEPAEKRPE